MNKQIAKISINNKTISTHCELANTTVTRFMGLMFRKTLPNGHSLLLDPCNQVHTFHMRFPIDVITLDADNIVISIFENVPAWRLKPFVKNGKKVLELNAGETQKFNITCGDMIIIENL